MAFLAAMVTDDASGSEQSRNEHHGGINGRLMDAPLLAKASLTAPGALLPQPVSSGPHDSAVYPVVTPAARSGGPARLAGFLPDGPALAGALAAY